MTLAPWTKRSRRQGGKGNGFPLTTFRSEMDRLFDRWLAEPFGTTELTFQPSDWYPTLDVVEKDNEVVLRAEVPGIEPEKIDVSVSDNIVTISGEKSDEVEEQAKNYYYCERSFGSFKRSIELPSSVDTKHITAEHENGVLTLRVPKLEKAKSRQIEVKPSAKKQQRKVAVTTG